MKIEGKLETVAYDKVTEVLESLDQYDLVELNNAYHERTGYGMEVLVLDIEALLQIYGVNLPRMCAKAGWKAKGGNFDDDDDFCVVENERIETFTGSQLWKVIDISDIVEEIVYSIEDRDEDVEWFTDWIELTDLTD